ncbi:MAG: thioredoxin domain-containing protein [Solirubrobacteraceae bacterium]|nr:thioredoxin domain-containing protein [Solirubrobacteraceae bacterium]
MPNALARETSPYLLQHAENPVDWLPWGEEALRRARDEDRPLLLSIGYSACHWCHVMERESFEDPVTAELMNEHFVCVKVDREERPDVDALYMEAVQAMTGQGGWPMNVFLTPQQVPFFGGTYFPPQPRHGLPAWRQVLAAVAEAWATRREEIEEQGDQMAARLAGGAALRPSADPIDPGLREEAVERLRASYDSVHGGWSGAPKFPAASAIVFLLARGERPMALHTLRSMASGGIFDQVGGGFARYSVDPTWTVPHFEKMLYDNALLARAYLHGWLASGDPLLRRTCEETLDWALREMRAADGGFFSALDADSEGVEGKFYVWTTAELIGALGPDAEAALEWFGATDQGNFADGPPGANVLESRGPEPDPETRARIRARLLEVRARRVRPGTDDKRLASWNALLAGALAEAGAALGREDYLDAARDTARFLLETLRGPDGRLRRTYNRGEARLDAYLEDHAFLLEALLALYEATFEEPWFTAARATADELLARFADPERGGFFSTADDAERLLARRKELEDHPIPSGAASAALGLLRLSLLTGEASYEEAGLGHLRLVHQFTARHPVAFGHTLQALDLHLGPTRELALVGDERAALEGVVRSALRPRLVLAGRGGDGHGPTAVALLQGRTPVGGRAAAYVCERFACRAPVTEPDELAALLDPPSPAAP